MIQELKTIHPKAKKEHICMYCGCKIENGEVYERQTNVYDGQVYDWVCHTDCQKLAQDLRMFDECDEGLTCDMFCEFVNDYIGDNCRVNGDVPENIFSMSKIDQVRMILSNL